MYFWPSAVGKSGKRGSEIRINNRSSVSPKLFLELCCLGPTLKIHHLVRKNIRNRAGFTGIHFFPLNETATLCCCGFMLSSVS